MNKFNQVISTEAAIKQCQENYEKHGDKCTIETSEVPWTLVGTIDIYQLYIRLIRTSSLNPHWSFSLRCGGMTTKSGYNSFVDALSAGLTEAENKITEFEEAHPELKSK